MSQTRRKPSKSKTQPQADRSTPFTRLDLYIALGILLAIVAAYAQVRSFAFIRYDDPLYVSENFHVIAGLTLESLIWAFTAVVDANWLPVTNLSHILDCQFFGLDSGMHHAVNILIHALAALLLFAALQRATRARWPSAFVAFIFALHPLHVESAAWISERKDVLSAFFWFLALYAYVRYAERPDLRRYLLVIGAFCLGLMAKPMLVTFPFTLLLLDVWPLRRAQLPRTLWEKLPLFALSLASSIVTWFVQRSGGAMRTFPLALRLQNALISYAIYLGKTFWPRGLAVFYPYPRSHPAWQVVTALAVIAAISGIALRTWRTRPYLAVGWLWYLGTLVPVIGLVQVGSQSYADRYTYIPMIGIAIMLAWGAADLLSRWPAAKPTILTAGAVSCLACAVLTSLQAAYWKNSEDLFQHALDVTRDNEAAEINLGSCLMTVPGRASDAISHFRAALRINPDNGLAHGNLGSMLENLPGHLDEAIAELRAAVRDDPNFAASHDNLANALAAAPGGLPEALREFETALRLDPNDADTHFDYGSTLARIPGRMNDAVAEYQAALRINPNHTKAQQALVASNPVDPAQIAATLAPLEAKVKADPNSVDAHLALAAALSKVPGREPDAMLEFQSALRLQPDSADAHFAFGLALSRMTGRSDDALTQYQSALRLRPNYPEAHNNLGVLLVNLGRVDEAITHFEAAARLHPDYQNERNLGIMLSKIPGKESAALTHLESAQRIRPTPEIQPIIDRLKVSQR